MASTQACMPHSPFNKSAWECLHGYDTFPRQAAQHVMLPSALELVLVDFINREPGKHTFAMDQAPIIFSYHLSGTGLSRMDHSSCRSTAITGEPQKAIIHYAPQTLWQTETLARQHYRILNIYTNPETLFSLLGEDTNLLPRDLLKVIESPDKKFFSWEGDMSPFSHAILDQIYNCPYAGALLRLHLECKSLELIIRQLYEMMETGERPLRRKMRPQDIERINQAKAILLEYLDSPPNLSELARQVGINTTKLKQGFREAFGITPYALVRQERLAQAQHLLREGQLNVTEISHHLGFSDTSHFIREFTKIYGTTPGRFAKSRMA